MRECWGATRNFSGQGGGGNILESFLLDTLKTTFGMENLTQRWTQSETFFQNQDTFFIFKTDRGEKNFKKNFMAPFYGWGSTVSRLEPLRGGSLLLTT